MEKVFGINTIRNGQRAYYIVWCAPAPADDSEPEYVKPLAVRMSLGKAQKALREFEEAYKQECLTLALHYADTEGDPYAGTAQES